MTPQAYLYICDGDIDHPVLTHKKMDWPEKYPHWQEIPLFMAQRTWVGLTPQERDEINEQVYGAVPHHVAFHAAIEQALREKNT